MATLAVIALSFAFAGFVGGWWTCNRLKDRRAERADASRDFWKANASGERKLREKAEEHLSAYALAARIDPAHNKPSHSHCTCRHD